MNDDLAPAYAIEIEGSELGPDLTQFIQVVEYESVDGMADEARLVVSNPNFDLSDAKVFQPGNEMVVYMGYGTQLERIGRVWVVRQRPNFPSEGMPIIELEGYTLDGKMMDNEAQKGDKRRWGGEKGDEITYDQIVKDKLADYGIGIKDVEEGPKIPKSGIIQKIGMTDYQVVSGIANLTGYAFWVDGDDKGWEGHFKKPESIKQDKKFTFRYNDGDLTTLFDFQPETLLKGAKTKLKVVAKDGRTGKHFAQEFEVTDKSQDIKYDGKPGTKIKMSMGKPSEVKIFLGDVAFKEISYRRFESAADAKAYAEAWFKKMQEGLITGRGTTIGVEKLMARQVHAIEGVSTGYDGDWYFHRVRHVMDAEAGYVCEFDARKVVKI